MKIIVDGAEVTRGSTSLPSLPGHLLVQHVQCGKLECRCRKGKPHGPYFYRIWREGERIRKVYVKATEAETVRAQIALYAEEEDKIHEMKAIRRSATKSILRQWAVFEKAGQLKKPAD